MRGNQRLGEFLRARRIQLRPEDVGLPAAARRRTPGLRREDVAARAGISTEWYVRLEQGRAVSPSAETITALGAALGLSPVEQDHLRRLAESGRRPRFHRETVPAVLRHIVAGMSQPAYITGQRWDVLAWNAAAARLLTDFGRIATDDRNILVFMFADPVARHLFGQAWAGEAERMVSLFRATFDLWPGDPAFAALVDRLHGASPAFAAWWRQHTVAAPLSGSKLLHPRQGAPVRFEHASFQCNDDPMLKLAIYTPADGAPGCVGEGADER